MTTEFADDALQDLRARAHSNCVVCSLANERGLHLEFSTSEDGSVQARFDCDTIFEGYGGMLHGGVIAMLLDAAMTNCLFAHGHPGVTAELTVRYRHPVHTGGRATVRAWVERCSPPLHVLRAELTQNRQLKATACGKFLKQTPLAGHERASHEG